VAPDSLFRSAISDGAVATAEPYPDPKDGPTCLEETTERDLEATLQLLAERAQFLTAASGVTIAICQEDEMICRAISGASSHQLEAPVPPDFGLNGECARTGLMVRCDDLDKDSPVDQESYRALGVRSMLAIPLMREQKMVGVLELTADRPCAFEERDVTALNRLSEMILTALEHAEITGRAMKEIASLEVATPETSVQTVAAETAPETPVALALRRCEACGFPISEGRSICLDCEEAGRTGDSGAANFLSELSGGNESWLESHMYALATLLMVVLTVVLLALKVR
jgi:putative methionine-R-sulfoxide reductase with GAF domain